MGSCTLTVNESGRQHLNSNGDGGNFNSSHTDESPEEYPESKESKKKVGDNGKTISNLSFFEQ